MVEQAWQQAYLDPRRALALGQRVIELGQPGELLVGHGWLHVALAEVRIGDEALAQSALDQARPVFTHHGDGRGSALCDEVQAILMRRAGDYAASRQLHADIDGRSHIAWTDHDRFLGHNSRAITHKLLGQADDALRHFYAALDAARATGWSGAVVTALGNLGGYHHDLYNLEDARVLCEQALQTGRAVGARQSILTAAANLIMIYHASGLPAQVRAMADYLLGHPDELLPGALDRFPLPLALAALDSGDPAGAQHYLDRGAVNGVADGDGLVAWAWLQARCSLARGDAAQARALVDRTVASRAQSRVSDQPYDLMQLHRAGADACEQLADLGAALAFTRRAQAVYEELVGRSARARYLALQVNHELASTQRERDLALQSHRTAEDDRRRLAELNRALEAKMAETELLHERLRDQALRDPLTGLHNRRYLFEVAPGMVERARRQASPLCVVLLDLDHFKAVNDNFGHDTGDAVLLRFSQLLTQTVRRSDVVCRHGGEEFVVVMPDIGVAGARSTLLRLLESCRALSPTGDLPACTFSAGLAEFAAHGGTLDQLLTRADRAMYAAKSGGRARIEQARESAFGSL
jgi:diguanylate cyclase (GGDEF)-like protein